ncbi:hypothetical protein QOZ89_24320 [Pseudofrankia sp. BMG5.37]|nr:hypothetical protein [Pseudofrankia sp. BMG5.37]MDT3442694.1 hypothetical protein [Pseudofrankia sp. BMG5.37]
MQKLSAGRILAHLEDVEVDYAAQQARQRAFLNTDRDEFTADSTWILPHRRIPLGFQLRRIKIRLGHDRYRACRISQTALNKG